MKKITITILILIISSFCFAENNAPKTYTNIYYNYVVEYPDTTWFIPIDFESFDSNVALWEKDQKAVTNISTDFGFETNLDTLEKNILDNLSIGADSVFYDSEKFTQGELKGVNVEVEVYRNPNVINYYFTAKKVGKLTIKQFTYALEDDFMLIADKIYKSHESLKLLERFDTWIPKGEKLLQKFYGNYYPYQIPVNNLHWKLKPNFIPGSDLEFKHRTKNIFLFTKIFKGQIDSLQKIIQAAKDKSSQSVKNDFILTQLDTFAQSSKNIFYLKGKSPNGQTIQHIFAYKTFGKDILELNFFASNDSLSELLSDVSQIIETTIKLSNIENSYNILTKIYKYQGTLVSIREQEFHFSSAGHFVSPQIFKNYFSEKELDKLSRLKAFKEFGFFTESEDEILDQITDVAAYEKLVFFNPKSNFISFLRPDLSEKVMARQVVQSQMEFQQNQKGTGFKFKSYRNKNSESVGFDRFSAEQSIINGEQLSMGIFYDFYKKGDFDKKVSGQIISNFPKYFQISKDEFQKSFFNLPFYSTTVDSIEDSIKVDWEKISPFVFYELKFPELYGMKFYMTNHILGGYAKVDSIFQNPPISFEQILHPQKYFESENPNEINLEKYSKVIKKWKIVREDNLGELYQKVLLKINLGEKFGTEALPLKESQNSPLFISATEGWNGDKYLHLQKKGKEALLFEMSWDTEKDAKEAFEAYKNLVKKQSPIAKTEKDKQNHFAKKVGKELNSVFLFKNSLLFTKGFSKKETKKIIEIFKNSQE
ncbi:MAG: hypothetical protein DWQ06_14865 [Calditrichaeota bacterium]|nr:MAG: hypothetical protein DWQ06_14865 [Calditrichota bacterium]